MRQQYYCVKKNGIDISYKTFFLIPTWKSKKYQHSQFLQIAPAWESSARADSVKHCLRMLPTAIINNKINSLNLLGS